MPYFRDFAEFIAMNGHGFYVWLSWGLVVFAVLWGVIHSYRQRQKLIQKLKIQSAQRQARLNTEKTP